MSDDIYVVVRALGTARKFCILRRDDQNVFSADSDDARALPHSAEVLESRYIQLAGKFPSGEQLFRLIDQSCALLVQCLGSDKDIVFILIRYIDDLRVSLMFAVVIARSEQRLRQLDRLSVFAELSSACVRRSDPIFVSVVASIEDIRSLSFAIAEPEWHPLLS